jgi:hypothetical protein
MLTLYKAGNSICTFEGPAPAVDYAACVAA